MDMISYWTDYEVIHTESDCTLITGFYNHKNNNNKNKALGIYWGDSYPQSRGVLSPAVIPQETRDAILSGLLYKAILDKDLKKIDKLKEAIEFFSN